MSINAYHAPDAADGLTATEALLAQDIEDYRVQNGLPVVPLSRSLSLVGARHDEDMIGNLGGYQAGIAGQNSAHGWSDAPYNALDPTTFSAIWSAPQRLGTPYPSYGFEILVGYLAPYTASVTISPDTALAAWKGSPGHNAVILNLAPWTSLSWGAMGVGMLDGVASVWFGADPDPAGGPDVTLQGNYADYTVDVSATAIHVKDRVASRDPEFTIPNAARLVFADGVYTVAARAFGYVLTAPAAGGTLLGGPGDDTLTGQGGDDILIGGGGNDLLDGGAGHDTAIFAFGLRGTTLTPQANGDVILVHGNDTDTLRSIESLSFIDGRLTFDAADPAAQVTRLYQAALGRTPDQAGLLFWSTALDTGGTLAALAGSFLGSPEFMSRFGGLDTAGFVTRLYQNVLGRAPDAGGAAFWGAQLDGGASRASVLALFSESDENKAGTSGTVAAGIWVPDPIAASVARLYDTVFARAPDLGGLTTWTGLLKTGADTLGQVTDAFMASKEFQQTYGGLGTAAFVTALYVNTLGRGPDAGGLAYWSGVLSGAAQSRASVVLGFSESAEHVARTATAIVGDGSGQRGILLS